MTTLTTPSLRPAFAGGLSLKAWFGGLKLLSSLLAYVGSGGIALLFFGQGIANAPEVDLVVARLPVSLVFAGLFCAGALLERWRRWQVEHLARQGWEMLLAGRPDAAIRPLEVAAHGGSDAQRARSHYGLTLAWLRKGDYERALSLCEATPARNAQTPALMAIISALYGELDDARTLVEEIRRPMFDKTDYALLAQAVMLCRQEKYVEAVKRIQRTARKDVPEMDVGAVAVIHAFARSRLGGQRVPLKPGCVLPEKPARASGYEYLARDWPELAAFLRGEDALHGADGEPAADALLEERIATGLALHYEVTLPEQPVFPGR
ncbi:hypothetical protein [Archangium sp.]|uniref:tetratricopeptide repeat protein n=1 Tax=Archangium sp. TaxID=1872627 RepID=UPI002D756995|nr:hypothetical protein [Archangium sp.]HYO55238.1 hypothetical protein [Archangium sp.]